MIKMDKQKMMIKITVNLNFEKRDLFTSAQKCIDCIDQSICYIIYQLINQTLRLNPEEFDLN